jgi:hypothetical protein
MLQFVFTDIGEDFNPEIGFIERVDMRHYRSAIELNPRTKNNRFIRGYQPHAIVRYSTDQQNRKLARDDHYGLFINFHDGSQIELVNNRTYERLDEPFQIRPGNFIPVGGYSWAEYAINYRSDRSKPLATSLSYRKGTFWNGDATIMRASLYVFRSPSFNAALSYNANRVDLPSGNFNADLTGLKVDYSFDPRKSLSAFVQYNNDTDRWITNIRFRLIHRPLSDIFVVYTDDNPVGARQSFRAFLVKYTQTFEF